MLIIIFFSEVMPIIRSKCSKIKPGDVIVMKSSNPFDDENEHKYKRVVDVKNGKDGKYIQWYFSDKEGNNDSYFKIKHTELYRPSDYKIINHKK